MSDAITATEPLETIVVTGRDRRSALGALFVAVNQMLEGEERDLTGRSIRFDVERGSFAETARALLEAALEFAGNESAAGIMALDGLIQTDDGFVGWGSLLLGGQMRARPVPGLHSLTVEQGPEGWRLTAIMRR